VIIYVIELHKKNWDVWKSGLVRIDISEVDEEQDKMSVARQVC
jgi:hypothetical protein